MLPIYVDYLGCFDRGVDDIDEAPDVIKDLVSML
jgi:hypothetical protein